MNTMSTAGRASLASKAWAKYGIDLGTFLVIAKYATRPYRGLGTNASAGERYQP